MKSRGYILLFALVFFAIFLLIATAFLGSITAFGKGGRFAVSQAQAQALAEAGIDKAAYELNRNSSYAGESGTALGDGQVTITVTTVDSTTRRVESTGTVEGSSVSVKATLDTDNPDISFRYGVLAGTGGFYLSGGATVNGNVYANASIEASAGSSITGSATAANSNTATADQTNATPVPISNCTSSTCITFGNTSAAQDVGQSFRLGLSMPLHSVKFYLKKVGTPPDATVRITSEASGSPSATTLMSGALSAASVTTSFGWVTVTLPPTPTLSTGQAYWLVIDVPTNNASNYYMIGANASYGNGVAKIGRYSSTWSATSPSGRDMYFQMFLTGALSMIGGEEYVTGAYVGTTALDTAWAYNVMGVTISGPLYCQVASFTNKPCNKTRPDPTPEPMPISDGVIEDWKAEAEAGGTITGDQNIGSAGATLGPKKIVGNLTVNGGGTLTVNGTLWVTGSITVNGGGQVKLATSYGANSGVIVSDGKMQFSGGATFSGSGTTGSYPFLLTTSTCPGTPCTSGGEAISLSGGAGAVVLIAQEGTIRINGGGAVRAITAKRIEMEGGATLTYDSGLISPEFPSGPGGSWAFVPGTYALTP